MKFDTKITRVSGQRLELSLKIMKRLVNFIFICSKVNLIETH